jgi:hypothetical protein
MGRLFCKDKHMPATLEHLAELRADVRHIQAGVDRVEARQDRAMSKLEEVLAELREHLIDDVAQFGRVDKRIELQGAEIREELKVAAAEKRGQTRVARMVYAAGVTVLSFIAAAFGGGHVHLPGPHQ